MTLAHYTLREITRRPGRTLLTFLGIVIGVAAIVGVSVTIGMTRTVYRDMFDTLTGKASLEVVSDDQRGFDAVVAESIAQVEGVIAAVPVIQQPAAFKKMGEDGKGASGVIVLGVDPELDTAARDYVYRSGGPLQSADDVLLGAPFAEANGIELGDTIRLIAATGFADLRVAGLLEARGAAVLSGGLLAIVSLDRAQRLFGMPGRINSLHLVTANQIGIQPIEERVGAALPAGLRVQSPSTRGELAEQGLVSTEQGLSTLSVVSLVAGVFVILNTFLMNLGERRRQIAILRAIGATERQVTRLLLREALLLGVVGTIGGMVAGVFFSIALGRVMEQLMGLRLPPLDLSPAPFIAALVIGPGMALASTWIPAGRASRRPPLQGLVEVRGDHEDLSRRWPAYAGIALIVITLLTEVAFLAEIFPPEIMTPMMPAMMAGTLAGCALAIPLILQPLMRAVAAALGPLLGIEGRLALRQLARLRTRTSLTAGVLFIAIAITVGMGNTLLNSVQDITQWYERNVSVDYYVRAFMPDSGMILTASMPETLEEEIAAIEGVAHVDKLAFITANASGQRALILARTFAPGRPLGLQIEGASEDEAIRRINEGEAILGATLAHSLKVKPGDAITLETREGPRPVRVAATTTEYTVGGYAMFLDWHAAKRLFNHQGAGAFLLGLKEGAEPAAGERLKAFTSERGLLLQSNADFRKMVQQMVDGVVGFLWLLMAFVFVVASLGIINTLTMNVLEQTRELGVLRAIAMKRGQIRKMILSQALGVGLVSLLPGTAAGLGISYLMNLTSGEVFGRPLAFELETGFVVMACVSGLAVSVIAALLPARRAAGLDITRALQYE